MSKKREKDTPKSRADRLIEEALKAVDLEDQAQPSSEDEEGLEVQSPLEQTSIARIDLQKFVDREAYKRLAADFENFRNRANKERHEAEKLGREKALRGFLEIFDNFDRALMQGSGHSGPFVEGIRMISAQMEMWIKSEGYERIATVGEIFDPKVHEAVSQVNRSDLSPGVVVEELRRGYRSGDRLLRPAAVVVNGAQREGE